jgi:hypothetical protein
MPLVSLTSNNPMVTCLTSKLLNMKLVTTMNMSCIDPFNIHKSKVQVIDKHKSNPQLHIDDHCFLQQCKHNL